MKWRGRRRAHATLRGVVRTRAFILAGAVALLGSAAPAGAQDDGGRCLTADPPPVTTAPQPLRFGITPGPAGSVGGGQGTVAAVG
jgi:hypothetical protein